MYINSNIPSLYNKLGKQLLGVLSFALATISLHTDCSNGKFLKKINLYFISSLINNKHCDD